MAELEDAPLLSAVAAARRGESADEIAWQETVDFIVVGFGGAGAAAALEGVERGLSVLAIDRFEGGGATALSGGVLYACGTRFQQRAGFTDTAEDMHDYLRLENPPVAAQTLRRFCDGSNADLEWLAAHGVQFDSTLFSEKTTYPPEGTFLYYSGNEKVPWYKERAKPAPRGHRAVGQGFTGYAYFGALKASAAAAGVRLVTHAPVRRLVVDRAGVVVGVEAHRLRSEHREQHEALNKTIVPLRPFRWKRHTRAIAACAALEARGSETVFFRARRGILLSGGGFVFSHEMLQRHRTLLAQLRGSLLPAGAMSCDGSGIELGRSVGGNTRLMESFFLGKVLAPPASFVRGVLVDATGRRFINEDAYTSALGNAVADLPEHGKAWLILDRSLFWEAVHKCIRPGKGMYLYTLPALANLLFGGTRRAQSIAKLAQICGLNRDTFSATIDHYNSAATGKTLDSLGKDTSNLAPVVKPPFYAIRMDLGNPLTPAMAFSLGGLVVDETTGAVLDRAGTAVPHLYAAGRNAVGLCSSGYISGMSIADTVFSGRRAARAVAGASELR